MGISYTKLNDEWKYIKSEKTGLVRGYDEIDKELCQESNYFDNGRILLQKSILLQTETLSFIEKILEDKLGCVILVDGMKSYYTFDFSCFKREMNLNLKKEGLAFYFYYRLPPNLITKFLNLLKETPELEILEKYKN
jgi:hypothetical protein